MTEEPFDRSVPIIDAHHHLYDRPGIRYLFEDLLADQRGGHAIDATVFVQARSMLRRAGPAAARTLGETEFATGVAAMSASGLYGPCRICAGIVGEVDLTLGPAAGTLLDAHVRIAGSRFKGVRHILAWDPDASLLNPAYPTTEHLMMAPSFLQGFQALADRRLGFDAWLYFHQLPALADLASRFPSVPIALNHMGGIVRIGRYQGSDDAVRKAWTNGLRELARLPNVVVKLSGLGMPLAGFGFERRRGEATSIALADAWRPWVDRCLEIMGAERCMVGSNFPADRVSYEYAVGWNAWQRLLAGASTAERHALFHRNAARFYGLEANMNERREDD